MPTLVLPSAKYSYVGGNVARFDKRLTAQREAKDDEFLVVVEVSNSKGETVGISDFVAKLIRRRLSQGLHLTPDQERRVRLLELDLDTPRAHDGDDPKEGAVAGGQREGDETRAEDGVSSARERCCSQKSVRWADQQSVMSDGGSDDEVLLQTVGETEDICEDDVLIRPGTNRPHHEEGGEKPSVSNVRARGKELRAASFAARVRTNRSLYGDPTSPPMSPTR